MEKKIGAGIAALRKKRGLTQEQLADMLGVSGGAVSKWERDSACPDITLLCPLARALGTNVDTLLRFEETLPEESLRKHIRAAVEAGPGEGEAMLEALLREYPSDIPLKYHAAAVLATFQLMAPERKADLASRKEALLEEVRSSGEPAYWQAAVADLAAAAVAEDQLDRAEQLLAELPERSSDPTSLRVTLYLRQGETEKAREAVQRQLYRLVNQTQLCLLQMAGEQLEPDPDRALAIAETARQAAELFGITTYPEPVLAELYLRQGHPDLAAKEMARYVDHLLEPVEPPSALLFSAVTARERAPLDRTARQLLLGMLESREKLEPCRRETVFREALERLRASL